MPQLEDQMYRRCENWGWSRHSPYGLKTLVESYPGCKDDFTDRGSLSDIRKAINNGKPCIVHGYSTGFGHIFVIRGYEDNEFICNDPWGEWFPWYYAGKGDSVKYSDRMIVACCDSYSQGEAMERYSTMDVNDLDKASNIWLHRISRT